MFGLRGGANLRAIDHLHARVCTSLVFGLTAMRLLHIHSTRHFAAERHSTEVEHWAQMEGKSETMSADLLESAAFKSSVRIERVAEFCPHCVASATIGAAIALILDRFVVGR